MRSAEGVFGLSPVRARAGRHRSRRTPILTGAAAAAVAAVIVASILLAGGGSHNSASSSGAPPRPTSGQAGRSSSHSAGTHATAPATPTVLSPVLSDSNEAIYKPAVTDFQLVLSATSGPCWVWLKQGSSDGSTLFEGTLQGGETRTVQMSGPAWIRLGNATNMVISVNNLQVQLPPNAGPSPYNLAFQT